MFVQAALADVRDQIEPGDLLLFRGTGLVSRLIGVAGRSPYTHAGKVDVWDGELYCCEVREFVGGRVVTLASQVERFQGRIDVYRVNATDEPAYDRRAAALYMRRFAGCRYGWWHVLGALILHVPYLRLKTKVDYTIEVDSQTGPAKPPYCSQAIALAERLGGGVDPVPNLPDRLTEPGDLARSSFYQYRFTLLP